MKKNIKTVIGIAIGLIIGISTTVGATTIFNSKDITYSSDKTDKTNVKDSLDELYIKAAKVGACPEGSTCLRPISTVEVGDYIVYQPTRSDFTISKSLTGYTSDQIIKPSEFYLWLVLRKNDNGTVEAASVSGDLGTTFLTFKGATGYKNYVDALQTASINIADGGEVFRGYGTRTMGYKNQALVCTAINTSSACPTDYDYYDDYQLFYHVAIANNNSEDWYASWMPSREWKNSTNLGLVYMAYNGEDKTQEVLVNNVSKEVSARLRPIVTFNSTVLVEARSGTRDKPLRVLNDSYTGR